MTSSWDLLEVVEEMPPTLEELYDRMMQQIQQLKWNDPEYCVRVLSAASLAYRPLHLAELGILSGLSKTVAANADTVREVVLPCGSFLAVQNNDIVHVSDVSLRRAGRKKSVGSGIAELRHSSDFIGQLAQTVPVSVQCRPRFPRSGATLLPQLPADETKRRGKRSRAQHEVSPWRLRGEISFRSLHGDLSLEEQSMLLRY